MEVTVHGGVMTHRGDSPWRYKDREGRGPPWRYEEKKGRGASMQGLVQGREGTLLEEGKAEGAENISWRRQGMGTENPLGGDKAGGQGTFWEGTGQSDREHSGRRQGRR